MAVAVAVADMAGATVVVTAVGVASVAVEVAVEAGGEAPVGGATDLISWS
jgi:hypothetical protein